MKEVQIVAQLLFTLSHLTEINWLSHYVYPFLSNREQKRRKKQSKNDVQRVPFGELLRGRLQQMSAIGRDFYTNIIKRNFAPVQR